MKSRGFSLVELVVIIAVISIILIGVIALTGRTFQVSRSQVEQGKITEEAQVEVDRMVELIRGARNLDCDGTGQPDRPEEFWLQVAEENRLMFYGNDDEDEASERIQYEVQEGRLVRRVDSSTTTPCAFQEGAIEVLSVNIRNEAVPLFSYVEADGTTLEPPVELSAVVRVLLDFEVDITDQQTPDAVHVVTEVMPRVARSSRSATLVPTVSPQPSASITPIPPSPTITINPSPIISVLPPAASEGSCAPVDSPSIFPMRTTDELEMEEARPASRRELELAENYLSDLATYDDRQAQFLSADERYVVFVARGPWRLFGQERFMLYHFDRQEKDIIEVSMVRGDWSFVTPTISNDGRYVATREYHWNRSPLSDYERGCVWRYDIQERVGTIVARPAAVVPYSIHGLIRNEETGVFETRQDADAVISPDGSRVSFSGFLEPSSGGLIGEKHLYLWEAVNGAVKKLTQPRYPEAYSRRGQIFDIRWDEPSSEQFTFATQDPREYVHSQNEAVTTSYNYDIQDQLFTRLRPYSFRR